MSKEFSLTAEQIQENYTKFFLRIDKLFPDRAESLKTMYAELGEDRLMFAPASSVNYYHNAIPGGYLDHVLRVMDFSILEYKHYESMGMDVSNFTLSELLFAAMHHDLGKLGFPGEGKDGYVFNTSEWHRKNQGKMYSPNENIPFTLVQDRSLFLLQAYNVKCTWNEYLGIRVHDGLYDDANKSYYVSKALQSKFRNTLPQVLHNADMAAARFEFERWNSISNEFNTTRIEDIVLKTNIVPTKIKPNTADKQKEIASKFASSFDDIFNKPQTK